MTTKLPVRTDSIATSARPAWAVIAWADDEAVYVELATKSGPPYIVKYPLSEAGLSKALAMMRTTHRAANGPRGAKNKPVQLSQFSDSQRDRASAVLKKLKMIG